jgi:lipoprotein-anchoring transpeptidase ErfK/SrfK
MDDKYDYVYYAPAEAFRKVPISELIPISSDIPAQEKRIWVDLSKQWLYCYEGSQLVFSSKISSGRQFDEVTYWTPEGEFLTFRKRPSRHMSSGNRATGYDLPGVPWVAYINEEGVAFHGTFWHNDFGSPRSHGCINMTPQAAKWLFRWTLPVVPATEQEIWVNYGTRTFVSV